MIAIRNAARLMAICAAITAAYVPALAQASASSSRQGGSSTATHRQGASRESAQKAGSKAATKVAASSPNFYVVQSPPETRTSKSNSTQSRASTVAKANSVRRLSVSQGQENIGQPGSQEVIIGSPAAQATEPSRYLTSRSGKEIPDLSPKRSGEATKTSFLSRLNPVHLFEREPKLVPTGYVQTGIASWYGADFHGGGTASGERYDMESLTAAHRSLPFGTLLRVTNLHNGRNVIVRVNNRGPYVKNRIIDLSKAAARQLGMIGRGVAKVKVEVLSLVEPVGDWGAKNLVKN